MTSRILKLVSIGIALVLIQACSHPIEIVGEGDVTSASGNRNCSLEEFQTAQDKCAKNLAIGDYTETYYAKPHDGWKFENWGESYCKDAAPPNYDCSFNIPAAAVRDFWGKTMPPLKAVFSLIADTDGDSLNDDVDPCPANPTNPCELITGIDVVTADGKEWAQPTLFTNLSWNQMQAACPNGECDDGAILNGRDMTGWTWASELEMRALFNFYGADLNLDYDHGVDSEFDSLWAPAFFIAGWRPTETYTTAVRLNGLTRTNIVMAPPYEAYDAQIAFIEDIRGSHAQLYQDRATTGGGSSRTYANARSGGWFYR